MEIPDFSDLHLPEKEEKILKSAIRVFSEKGFSAATTSEIAKGAGIAEGTIFRYFKTKKDILRGILIQMINLLSGKLVMGGVEKILADQSHKDMRSILRAILYDRMKLLDNVFPMARVVLTEAMFHEDVREAIFQNVISRAMGMFRTAHADMVQKGLIRECIEPEVLFRSILANVAIFIAQRKLFSDKLPMEDMDKEFDKMLDVLLYGIAPQQTHPTIGGSNHE